MGYKERKEKIDLISKEIINQQYDDRVEFGIDNHFLMDTMNNMIQLQAPRIKEFADFLSNHGENVDDHHSLVMTTHLNTDEKSVFTIKDETIYGPNLDHIIVINDKENGKLHIRRLSSMEEISEYEERGYKPFGDSFVTKGFVFTYNYMTPFMKRMLDRETDFESDSELVNQINELRKIEEMGDNTFHLYECVVYATSLMASIKRTIEQD